MCVPHNLSIQSTDNQLSRTRAKAFFPPVVHVTMNFLFKISSETSPEFYKIAFLIMAIQMKKNEVVNWRAERTWWWLVRYLQKVNLQNLIFCHENGEWWANQTGPYYVCNFSKWQNNGSSSNLLFSTNECYWVLAIWEKLIMIAWRYAVLACFPSAKISKEACKATNKRTSPEKCKHCILKKSNGLLVSAEYKKCSNPRQK